MMRLLNDGDDDDCHAARVTKEEADSSSSRICDYCGKRFGSGNALGGHMRIHTRVHRRSESEVAITADKNPFEKLPSSGEAFSCRICGKKFESWKSVFGHMRKHPDREWRGMQWQLSSCAAADQVSSASFSSTVSDNYHQMHNSSDTVVRENPNTDLTKYLSFWSVTGKRGRKDKRNVVLVPKNAVATSPGPRSRLSKKKMRKLSDLEANHRQEIDTSKQVSYGCRQCYMSFPTYQALNGHLTKHIRQLHGGSWNLSEIESATTNSSVTSSIKTNMIMSKNSDHKEILTACREDLHHSAEHGYRKLLQIDLNELPPIEEDEDKGIK